MQRLKENWICFSTILRKEVVRVLRIWPQTLLPPVITMSLYFMIFGNLIGERIGLMANRGYMEYITPGLIMMSIITNAYANVVSSFFGSKFQRNIEELLISPANPSTILFGYLSGGIVRGLLVGLLVFIVSLFFNQFVPKHLFLVFVFAVLTSILFAIAGLINGIFAKKFDDISIIPTFVLTPLTYLGGVFYSIELLSDIWQTVTHFNPIFYMVNGFRYAMLGEADIEMNVALSVTVGFIILLYSLAFWLFNKGVGVRS